MSTIEDFRNAPVGATATNSDGSRAVKIDDGEQSWMLRTGAYVQDELLECWDYTLDRSAPTTAQEALDLAWELAHPVKEEQVISARTQYLGITSFGVGVYTAQEDLKIDPEIAPTTRTFDPLPDPKPDWLDAPAVMARLKTWIPSATPRVFARYEHDHGYWLTIDPPAHHWSELENVTPLYPKEQA